MLVIADEDVTGVNPTYPAGTAGPKYLDDYMAALDANGIGHDTWDVDSQGVPHPLGVLDHYDAVIWELGDNRLTQDEEDFLTDTYRFGPLEDLAVAEKEQYLTLAVRDYLNEGGKLLQTGETTGYFGQLGGSLGGIYYGLDGAPEEDCVVTEDFFSDCLLLADDFHQYYLGAYARTTFAEPGRHRRHRDAARRGGRGRSAGRPPSTTRSTRRGPSRSPATRCRPTSSRCSPARRRAPTSAPAAPTRSAPSRASGTRRPSMPTPRTSGSPARSTSRAWPRPTLPRLEFQLSYSTELGYDHVIVEAAPSGTDQWTTLPDLNGGTTNLAPIECEGGFLLAMHPFLTHYLTGGNPCGTTGSTGSWNSFTGESGGWQQVAFDLSAYVAGPVDVKISYVTDPNTGGIGAFVDDTHVVTTAGELDADGFESDTSLWEPEGSPTGSAPNAGDFQFAGTLVEVAASVTTEDSVLLGYGIEQLATPAEQADVLGRIMTYLLS